MKRLTISDHLINRSFRPKSTQSLHCFFSLKISFFTILFKKIEIERERELKEQQKKLIIFLWIGISYRFFLSRMFSLCLWPYNKSHWELQCRRRKKKSKRIRRLWYNKSIKKNSIAPRYSCNCYWNIWKIERPRMHVRSETKKEAN